MEHHVLIKLEHRKNKNRSNSRGYLYSNGEPWRIRTSDTLIKSQVLYLLS
jgi:hypothetical protein